MDINQETKPTESFTSLDSSNIDLIKSEIEATFSENSISLDDHFLLLPEIKKPVGFDNFWKECIKKLKNENIKSHMELLSKSLISKNIFYNIALETFDSYLLKAKFILILKKKKNPAILYLENYEDAKFDHELTKIGVSQFFLFMRNTNILLPQQKEPELLQKRLDNKDNFFLKQFYFDSFCSLKLLSAIQGIDKKNIILSGKGMGSSAAIFSAAHFANVKGLILDEISVGFISEETFKLKEDWMRNIQKFLKDNFLDTKNFLSTLKFFDILYFVQKIKIPTLLFVKYDKENLQKSKQAFAFFNHLTGDKRVKIFIDNSKENIEEKNQIKNNFINELLKIE